MTLEADLDLERRIERAALRLHAASGPRAKNIRREAWREMQSLIAQRSPEQIARMERERGL